MNLKSFVAVTASAGLLAAGLVGTAAPAFAKVTHKAKTSAVQVITTKLETGKQDGKKGWPKYVPGTFHAKAGQLVKLTIYSYDDGQAQTPAGYLAVKGTVNNVEWVDGKKVTKVTEANIAHTMTIMAGNQTINIPIPVRSAKEKFVTVTAEFKFAKAGTFNWQCYAACGTGKSGWMGPMMTMNWMKGVWHVS